MINIVLLACAGVLAGAFTGLVPGVHPNTLAALIISASPALLAWFSPVAVAVFIITSAITHTFLSYIPSVFIGAPDGGTALSVLPGHRMLLQGRGYEAVYLTVIGGVGVMVLSIIMLPVLLFTLPVLYAYVKLYMAWLLLGIVGVMVGTERGVKKVLGCACFLLSGLMGMIALETPVLPSHLLLFPIFTGLFGISTLLIGIRGGTTVPEQKGGRVHMKKRESFFGIVKGLVSGIFVGIMPGLGAAQAGMLTHIMNRGNTRNFLVSLGGINTVAALFSLLSLYLISRPRSGAAVAVQTLIEPFGFQELLVCVAAALFATGFAALLTLRVARLFLGILSRVDYSILSWWIVVFLVGLVALMAGAPGIILLFVSTAIGILAPLWGVKRTHCMGVLMLPIILWYLGI